jgi:hypothetical protein
VRSSSAVFTKSPQISTAAVLVFYSITMPAHAGVSLDSVVIGRLNGTLHEPPRSFLGNSPTVGGARGSVEIKGFRLVRDDGKTFTIRPLGSGYYRQALPPGEYTLVRKRTDRPLHKEDKVIRILTFTVTESSLINLGTLDIVLQGKPEELFFRASRNPKGKYIYRYRYERADGEEAMAAPLEWFMEKKKSTAANYAGRVVTIDTIPTDLADSSRFTLRETVFQMLIIKRQ